VAILPDVVLFRTVLSSWVQAQWLFFFHLRRYISVK
jgi:hypothetical protein